MQPGDDIDPANIETSAESEPVAPGCLLKIGYAIGWILLFGLTLNYVGEYANEQLVKPSNREGYGALLGIGGVFFFMPMGLLISFLVLAASKRRAVFFGMAVGLAAALAFGAALM